ncbi:MAG TPA: hypothetical protein HA354_00615, partial [Candidatus Poseidoniaceae archaeon]
DGLQLRRALITDLAGHLVLEAEPEVISEGTFEGMSFCITGTLSQPRKAIQLMVKGAGGKVVGSISGKLDVLIAGENAGSKLTKAQSIGVTVWTEAQLLSALDNPAQSKPLGDTNSSNVAIDSQKSLLDF